MKIKADKCITQKVNIDITGITLLSVEEAEALPKKIRDINKSWWLRSPGGYYRNAAIVYDDGDVVGYGHRVYFDSGVRPALEVGYERMCMVNPQRLDRGDKIKLAGQTWTVISDQYILCDDIIGKHTFRKDYNASDANDYKKSDVKKFLEDWFKKNIKEAV